MQYKSTPAQNFTAGDNGSISGYFATYHHDKPDSYGDVIRKGAFAKTIAERKRSGHPFPLCNQHDMNQVIGRVTDIGEDDYGAYFTAEFFPTDRAQEIRGIVLSGAVWQFSFAYNIIDQAKITLEDGTKANELRELELIEISVVVCPANDRATVTDIKAASKKRWSSAAEIWSLMNQLKSSDPGLKKQAEILLREELRYGYDAEVIYHSVIQRLVEKMPHMKDAQKTAEYGLMRIHNKIDYLEKALIGHSVLKEAVFDTWGDES